MDFSYKAIDSEGRHVTGIISANSEFEALEELKWRQLIPLELSARSSPAVRQKKIGRSARVSPAQLGLALRELATLLTSGVGLVEAVENLTHAHRQDFLGEAFSSLGQKLLAGEAFSQSIGSLGLDIPDFVVLLARSGEMTGKLGQSMLDAADQMDYQEQIRGEVRNALVYPIILVITGLISVLLIFLIVVPKFAGLLNDPRASLPILSIWVLAAGMFLRDNLFVLGAGCLVAITTCVRLLGDKARRAKTLELLASFPFFGEWLESVAVARWSSIFAVLIENRVSIIDAMEQAKGSSSLGNFTHRLDLAQRDVKAGKRLAESLELHRVLDPTSVSMIRVGERTGELAKMLKVVASYWSGINRNRVKRLLAMLEPLTILIIGAAIGTIMVAIMLAIASLSNLTS